mgnify:CR=1 FL=1
MKLFHQANGFLLKRLISRSVNIVEIANADFIRTIPVEDHLAVTVFTYEFGDQIVAHACSNRGGIIGFDVVNHLGDGLQELFFCELDFVVIRADVVGHNTGKFQIDGTAQTNGKCLDALR